MVVYYKEDTENISTIPLNRQGAAAIPTGSKLSVQVSALIPTYFCYSLLICLTRGEWVSESERVDSLNLFVPQGGQQGDELEAALRDEVPQHAGGPVCLPVGADDLRGGHYQVHGEVVDGHYVGGDCVQNLPKSKYSLVQSRMKRHFI